MDQLLPLQLLFL